MDPFTPTLSLIQPWHVSRFKTAGSPTAQPRRGAPRSIGDNFASFYAHIHIPSGRPPAKSPSATCLPCPKNTLQLSSTPAATIRGRLQHPTPLFFFTKFPAHTQAPMSRPPAILHAATCLPCPKKNLSLLFEIRVPALPLDLPWHGYSLHPYCRVSPAAIASHC
jgi:hypothetical protein